MPMGSGGRSKIVLKSDIFFIYASIRLFGKMLLILASPKIEIFAKPNFCYPEPMAGSGRNPFTRTLRMPRQQAGFQSSRYFFKEANGMRFSAARAGDLPYLFVPIFVREQCLIYLLPENCTRICDEIIITKMK